MATINTINTATDTPASAATKTNDNFTSLETDVNANTAKAGVTPEQSSEITVNTAKVSASGSINTHSDVDTSTTPPTNEQTLSWNSATEKWEPRTADAETQVLTFPVLRNTAGATANPYTTAVGDFTTANASSGNDLFFHIQFPSHMQSIVGVDLVMIPDTTETIQADFFTNFGGEGEIYNAHSRSSSNDTFAVTINYITSWDLTSLGADIFASVEAGDVCGLRVSSDTSSIRVLYVRLTIAV